MNTVCRVSLETETQTAKDTRIHDHVHSATQQFCLLEDVVQSLM